MPPVCMFTIKSDARRCLFRLLLKQASIGIWEMRQTCKGEESIFAFFAALCEKKQIHTLR